MRRTVVLHCVGTKSDLVTGTKFDLVPLPSQRYRHQEAHCTSRDIQISRMNELIIDVWIYTRTMRWKPIVYQHIL